MSANRAISEVLHEMSQMLDLLGEDSFRASSHARAARAIEDLPGDVAELAKDRKALLATPGIGPKMADKVIEFVTTGAVKEYAELAAKVPPGLLLILKVPGLGPKTVRAMWMQLNVTDLAGLKRVIDDGSILTVPRVGEKLVEKIKLALVFAAQAESRLWLGRALPLAEEFLELLRGLPGVAKAECAGSLRRGRETIGDIDLIVAMSPGKEALTSAVGEAFRGASGVAEVLAAGDSKSSVRARLTQNFGRWKKEAGDPDAGPTVQVDLRVVPLSAWGSALLYFTGSKEHNVRLRERALRMGLTLNEWGLFPLGEGEKNSAKAARAKEKVIPPQDRGIAPIASATEEDLYAALKLPLIPPEIREDRGEFDAPGPIRLIERADIKAELHAHTTASDGSLSIEELAEHARAQGFHTIAVTDHSRSSAVAGGLTIERLLEHIEAVRAVNAKLKGTKRAITVLAGSEVDILADGTLDYPDDILKQLDIVVASPHSGLTQQPEAATTRLIKAISNPYVHILGHATGRLINRRAGLSPDMAALFKAAAEHRVALEVNSHWMRLDLRDTHVRQAVNAGCLLAIDCDVHAASEFGNLRYGIATARRGWLTPERCVNAWEAGKLYAWLKSKGSPV